MAVLLEDVALADDLTRITGREEDAKSWAPLLKCFREGASIGFGQNHIGQQKIDVFPGGVADGDGGGGILRIKNSIAEGLQQANSQLPKRGIVFHEENGSFAGKGFVRTYDCSALVVPVLHLGEVDGKGR